MRRHKSAQRSAARSNSLRVRMFTCRNHAAAKNVTMFVLPTALEYIKNRISLTIHTIHYYCSTKVARVLSVASEWTGYPSWTALFLLALSFSSLLQYYCMLREDERNETTLYDGSNLSL